MRMKIITKLIYFMIERTDSPKNLSDIVKVQWTVRRKYMLIHWQSPNLLFIKGIKKVYIILMEFMGKIWKKK